MTGDGASTEPTAEAAVAAFLARHLRRSVEPETDIFATGLVDSLFALQLVEFIESRFGIEIGNEDLEMANFRSLGAIARFVARKTARAEP